MNTVAIRPLPQNEMQSLAERAAVLSNAFQVNVFFRSPSVEPSTSLEDYDLSSRIAYGVRQFGLIATAASLLGATSGNAGDVSTRPAISLDAVRGLAVAKQITHETPTVEHVWSKRSSRVRRAAREFGESTNANY